MSDKQLTIKEAAERLGIGLHTAEMYLSTDKLDGNKKARTISAEGVERYMNQVAASRMARIANLDAIKAALETDQLTPSERELLEMRASGMSLGAIGAQDYGAKRWVIRYRIDKVLDRVGNL